MTVPRMLVTFLVLLCAATPGHADTLSEITKTGVFKIGYRDDVPPFSRTAGDGQPEGFSIDICNVVTGHIKDRLGMPELTVQFVPVTAASRLHAVASGRVHIECGNTTRTLPRQETVDFSNLFYLTGASLMTTPDVEVSEVADLAGRRVAVVENTTTLGVLRARLKLMNVSADLQVVSNHKKAMALLEDKQVELVAADRATLLGLGFASEKLKVVRLTPLMLSFEPYAFPVRRNDADFRLLVNQALARLYLSGQVEQLWLKWFGSFEARPNQLMLDLYRLNSLGIEAGE